MLKRIVKVAAHGLIKKNNKYLVTKRAESTTHKPGYWDIPGGTVKYGENVNKALKREFIEETGLKVKSKNLLFVYDYLYRFPDKYRHQFQLVFECYCKSGKIKLNPSEHSEYRWVTLSELGKLKKIAFLKALYNRLVGK